MATRPAKTWEDDPSTDTPLDAAGLIDLEARVFGYSEEQLATRDIPVPGASEDGWVPVYDHGTTAMVWTDVGGGVTQTDIDNSIATHNADTTSVHGIADTSALLTSASTAGGDLSGTLSNLQLGSGVVTATEVNGSLKPSGSAATTDESLRRLGTGSTHAAAGDDSRFPSSGEKNALAGTSGTPGSGNKYVTDGDSRNSDTRTPTDGSVTLAKLNAAVKPSGSAAASDEAVRALGTSGSTAAAGNDSRFPTAAQKNALAGTSGTPDTGNEYATKATTDGLSSLLSVHGSATTSVHGISNTANLAYQADLTALLAGYTPIYVSPMGVRNAGGTQLTRAVMNQTITSSFNGWTASPAAVGFASVPIIGSGLFSISGKTTKLKTVLTIFTNATAPTISFTAGISVLASAGGADALSISWSTEVSGSTCTVTTPGASAVTSAVSSAYDAPADGAYAPVFSMSGAMPATNPRVGVVMSIWRAYA